MFGKNEIVGRKTFMQAPPGTLHATSLFYTLQGEGPFAGRPAMFLRLAKCNLACSFCDTFFDAGDWLTYEEIELRMSLILKDRRVDDQLDRIGLVVTGGEPLLQPNLAAFLERCVTKFKWVQVETNGTQWLPMSKSVTVVVSPKCAEKDGVATHYLKPQTQMLDRADCLKFVMRAPISKTDPYADVPEWAQTWSDMEDKPIYVSPMNVYNDVPAAAKAMRWVGKEVAAIPDMHMRSTVDEVISFWEPGLLDMAANELNHKYAAVYAMAHCYRFNLQMHLYAGIA